MLQRRQVRFGNLSLMARGVALVGLIVAAVCDLCFTHALLGFCLGLVFLIAATIMALCFDASARLQCDEDEPERQGDVDAFNHQLTATTVSVLSLIGCVLAFLLPLLLVEAYYGMATGSWLLLGLGCVAVALGVGHVVYTLWLRPVLVRRGLLGQELLIRTQRDKGLLRRFLKVTLPATAVGIVLIIVLEASGAAWLAKAETFDNYADFEKFMYDCAMEEAQKEWDGFTLIPLEKGYRVMDGSDIELTHPGLLSDKIGQHSVPYLQTGYLGQSRRYGNSQSYRIFYMASSGRCSIRQSLEKHSMYILSILHNSRLIYYRKDIRHPLDFSHRLQI